MASRFWAHGSRRAPQTLSVRCYAAAHSAHKLGCARRLSNMSNMHCPRVGSPRTAARMPPGPWNGLGLEPEGVSFWLVGLGCQTDGMQVSHSWTKAHGQDSKTSRIHGQVGHVAARTFEKPLLQCLKSLSNASSDNRIHRVCPTKNPASTSELF